VNAHEGCKDTVGRPTIPSVLFRKRTGVKNNFPFMFEIDIFNATIACLYGKKRHKLCRFFFSKKIGNKEDCVHVERRRKIKGQPKNQLAFLTNAPSQKGLTSAI
jgi:hypothetical protein